MDDDNLMTGWPGIAPRAPSFLGKLLFRPTKVEVIVTQDLNHSAFPKIFISFVEDISGWLILMPRTCLQNLQCQVNQGVSTPGRFWGYQPACQATPGGEFGFHNCLKHLDCTITWEIYGGHTALNIMFGVAQGRGHGVPAANATFGQELMVSWSAYHILYFCISLFWFGLIVIQIPFVFRSPPPASSVITPNRNLTLFHHLFFGLRWIMSFTGQLITEFSPFNFNFYHDFCQDLGVKCLDYKQR